MVFIRLIITGNVIEKAGIHFASMNGNLPSMAIQQMKRDLIDLCPEGLKFFVACGYTIFLTVYRIETD